MAVIIDEEAGTLTVTNLTVTFPYNFNAQTVVGTVTFTAAGGFSTLNMAIEGDGGPPSPPSAVNITYIPHDKEPEILPPTINSPGGPGEPADWELNLEIPAGEPGTSGTFAILAGTDLADIPEDTATAKYALVANAAGDAVEFAALPFGEVKWPSSISAKTSNNTTPAVLATVTFLAKPYAWFPLVSGTCSVSGSSDTRVDLVAYLGDPAGSGKEIGRAFGQAGIAPPPLVLPLGPPVANVPTDGVVPAGQPATVYFRAEQMAASSNNWGINNSSARFAVAALPVS